MGSGLIESEALTPANVSDQAGFKHICPRGGEMVFGDTSYCLKPAQIVMAIRGAVSGAILKHNMIGKHNDLDRWLSSVRAPLGVLCLNLAYSPKILQNLNIKPLFLTLF